MLEKKQEIFRCFYGGFPYKYNPTLEILKLQLPASSNNSKKSDPNKALFCFCCLIINFSRSNNNNRSPTISPGCLYNILLVGDLALLKRHVALAVAATFHINFNAFSGSRDKHQ